MAKSAEVVISVNSKDLYPLKKVCVLMYHIDGMSGDYNELAPESLDDHPQEIMLYDTKYRAQKDAVPEYTEAISDVFSSWYPNDDPLRLLGLLMQTRMYITSHYQIRPSMIHITVVDTAKTI
ncbi:MAG: hypothetical protein Greene041614_993 [Parcubacteria group bacterium Greene0416_14]|nr:MAG: hypothetical protein Greene041614_993 [Parcubacteria group bacterium Greene0416_14]TSC99947.1 MAG: hypothetical protein Greene101415_1017 [Parcubacteria group bacterium Greene1014_15]TSD07415.1 MAG: hypothetical protein Greene07144_907 [Parcubacteria group bacterium Greene0714_4]